MPFLNIADKNASAVTKNLGLGCNSRLWSESHFLSFFIFIHIGLKKEHRLGPLQHSLWPDIRSNHLATWTKALIFLFESMNFHPDKQLFQVAGVVDRTTDPWITRPVLYPYNTFSYHASVLCGWKKAAAAAVLNKNLDSLGHWLYVC